MPTQITEQKKKARRAICLAIDAMSATERRTADALLCTRFRSWLENHTGRTGDECWNGITALLYMPLPDEPNITPLATECVGGGGRLILPRLQADATIDLCVVSDMQTDLAPGRYGILEPNPACECVSPDALDLLLVPGRGFSPGGLRLGRGKGCYDRLLGTTVAPTIALAYDCQIRATIPAAEHDERVDIVLTPTQIFSPDAKASS